MSRGLYFRTNPTLGMIEFGDEKRSVRAECPPGDARALAATLEEYAAVRLRVLGVSSSDKDKCPARPAAILVQHWQTSAEEDEKTRETFACLELMGTEDQGSTVTPLRLELTAKDLDTVIQELVELRQVIGSVGQVH